MGMFDRLGDFLVEGNSTESSDGDAGDADLWPDESTAGPEQFATDAREAVEQREELEPDFGVDSLARVDEYAVSAGGGDGGSTAESLDRGRRREAAKLGAYFGEVLVRQFDGEWVAYDGWAVAVPGADGLATVPVFDVAKQSITGQPGFAETAERVAAVHEPSSAPGILDALEDGPYTGEVPEGEVAEQYRLSAPDPTILERLATTLADTWPEYDLDRSTASLARLDDLLRTEIDDPSSQAAAFGAYLGAVFVDAHDGTWTEDDDAGWVVELSGRDGQFVLSIPLVLDDCLSGEATFRSICRPSTGSVDGASDEGDEQAAETADSPADDEPSRTVTYRGREYDPSEIEPVPVAEEDDESSRTATYRGREYDPSEMG